MNTDRRSFFASMIAGFAGLLAWPLASKGNAMRAGRMIPKPQRPKHEGVLRITVPRSEQNDSHIRVSGIAYTSGNWERRHIKELLFDPSGSEVVDASYVGTLWIQRDEAGRLVNSMMNQVPPGVTLENLKKAPLPVYCQQII